MRNEVSQEEEKKNLRKMPLLEFSTRYKQSEGM